MKNITYIVSTGLIAIAVSIYLMYVNAQYDGALIKNMTTFVCIIPFVLLCGGYRIITGNGNNKFTSLGKMKYLYYGIFALLIAVSLYILMCSNFCYLEMIILCTLCVLCLIVDPLVTRLSRSNSIEPMMIWALGVALIYLTILLATISFLSYFKPVTLEEARNIIADEYGEGTYELSYYIESAGSSSLGAYGFYTDNPSDIGDEIRIDVLTGDSIVS